MITATMTASLLSRCDETPRALRGWAHGLRGLEAAVELLIRVDDGRLAEPSMPWILRDGPCVWLDPDQITRYAERCAPLDVPVLTIVAALASGGPVGQLADLLRDLDRETLRLALAAFCHAGGGDTHRTFQLGEDGSARWVRLAPLVDWS